MQSLLLIGTVVLLHAFAVMSPGPDFILCVRNSLAYSRKIGFWTAVGFGAGIAIHIIYSFAGLALIISQSIVLFNVIKFLGASYLVYIGVRLIISHPSTIQLDKTKAQQKLSSFGAFKMGMLTNILNPKASIFFLSLFTMVLSPSTPTHVIALVSIIMVVDTILWFTLVSFFLTQKPIRILFERFQWFFNKIFGGLLIALWVKVACIQR